MKTHCRYTWEIIVSNYHLTNDQVARKLKSRWSNNNFQNVRELRCNGSLLARLNRRSRLSEPRSCARFPFSNDGAAIDVANLLPACSGLNSASQVRQTRRESRSLVRFRMRSGTWRGGSIARAFRREICSRRSRRHTALLWSRVAFSRSRDNTIPHRGSWVPRSCGM